MLLVARAVICDISKGPKTESSCLALRNLSRFPSSPVILRVPFFLLFGFNKGTLKEKGQKGTTGEPS